MLVQFIQTSLGIGHAVDMEQVPRIGDKVNIWCDPEPTVVSVLWLINNSPDGAKIICEVE